MGDEEKGRLDESHNFGLGAVIDSIVSSPNSYVEARTHSIKNVAIFGDKAFKKVIQGNMGLLAWALIQSTGVLIKRRDLGSERHQRCSCTEDRPREKAAGGQHLLA